MTDQEVDQGYAMVDAIPAYQPGGMRKKLEADHLEVRRQLADVLKRIVDSGDWWMSDPFRGGFDVEAIRKALGNGEAPCGL